MNVEKADIFYPPDAISGEQSEAVPLLILAILPCTANAATNYCTVHKLAGSVFRDLLARGKEKSSLCGRHNLRPRGVHTYGAIG